MTRPNPPCMAKDGADCPNRAVGCHAKCEKYQAFRAECDRLLAENREKYIGMDYASHSIYRRRATLKHTHNGRKALASW